MPQIYNGPVVHFFVYRIITFAFGSMANRQEAYEWGFYNENGERQIQSSEPHNKIIEVAIDMWNTFPTIFTTDRWSLDYTPPNQVDKPYLKEPCNDSSDDEPNKEMFYPKGPAVLSSQNRSQLYQAFYCCDQKFKGLNLMSSLVIDLDKLEPDWSIEHRLMEAAGTLPTLPQFVFDDDERSECNGTLPKAIPASTPVVARQE